MNHRKISILLLLILSWSNHAIDNHHFYRASNFFTAYDEPRFEEKGLASLDVTLGGGWSRTSRNGCGAPFDQCNKESCLLNICGFYDMRALGLGLPNKDLNNPVDLALTDLSMLPARGTFGMLSFAGKFSILEANFFYTQNFACGFFFQTHVPVRKMTINNISFVDLSPDDNLFPNVKTAQWQNFLNLFPQMLERYNLSIGCTQRTGLGDISFLGGWTCNYENTETLDFVDLSIRAGVLVPSGEIADVNKAFDLPGGYNGHVGVPISFDVAFGLYEWMTLGFHLGAMPFGDKEQCVRITTDPTQQGLIKLVSAKANVHEGTLWDAVGYFKADHFCRGLSLLFAYTYAKKKPNVITEPFCLSQSCSILDDCINLECLSSCDLVNGGWNMQTFNILAEYDFTNINSSCFTPRLGLFYNAVVGGERIFTTNVGGMTAGLDISWVF